MMVRCQHCNHMVAWTERALTHCPNCHQLVVMPDRQTANNAGVFTGVTPPYFWVVDGPEATIILDGLEALMVGWQEALQGDVNTTAFEALTGSFVFAKMTRAKFRKLAPDLVLEG